MSTFQLLVVGFGIVLLVTLLAIGGWLIQIRRRLDSMRGMLWAVVLDQGLTPENILEKLKAGTGQKGDSDDGGKAGSATQDHARSA